MQHDHKVTDIKGGGRSLKPPPAFHDDEHPVVHDESNWLVSYADMMTLLFGFFVIMYSLSKVDRDKFEIVSKDIAKYFGGTVKDKAAGFKMQDELKDVITRAGIGDGVEVTSTDNGITLKFNGSVLFDSGSARLKPEMQPTLTEIVRTIEGNRAVDRVSVEGHTDDDAIESNVFPTNWELSAARASRVARHFEAYGFASDHLVAEGYGASRPLAPNRNPDGTAIKENQLKNRRVVIRVSFGAKSLDAAKALDSSKYSVENPKGLDAAAEAAEGEAAKNVGPTVTLEQRLDAAKTRLDSAQKKLKEMETEAQKKSKLADLEKKIQDMETKSSDTEKRIQQISGSPPAAPAPNPNTELSLKEGLKQLQPPGPQAPAAGEREPARAKAPAKKARASKKRATASAPTTPPATLPAKAAAPAAAK